MWLEMCVIFVVLVCWAVADTRKPMNFPPGPSWLPLLGSLLYVKSLVEQTGFHHLAWAKLAEQYGSVVGLKLGMTPPTVLVSGKDAVLEVLNGETFDGRPDNFVENFRTMGKKRGVIFTDGQVWKEQRRFLLKSLKDFGFGKRCMETLIIDEAQACVNKLRTIGKQNKEGAPMSQAFTVPVLNSLWSLIAGIRFDDNHPTLVHFIEKNNEFLHSTDATGGILNYFPNLRHIAPKASGFAFFSAVQTQMWAFFSEFVWEHKQTVSSEYSRDLIDVYLREFKEGKEDVTTHFTEMQLVGIMKDLFGAGSETSSNSLSYAVLYLLLNPDVQVKAQQEVDRVIGRDRQPALQDRISLPYVNAVIMETQRMSNIAPLTIPHRAMCDTHIGGYYVAKDTTVVVSLWSMHMDVQRWGDPHVFRPERFLDPQGKLLAVDVHFIPFGAGHRRCLGENMARDTLFLFFSLMLQQLSFTLPLNTPPPAVRGVNGFTLSTGPYNAVITTRV